MQAKKKNLFPLLYSISRVFLCMEITQEMKEAMILSLLRHDKTPSGAECSFFKFGTVGVKFYGYGLNAKSSAKKAFDQQSRCYASGLAPKPGKVFAITVKGAGDFGEAMQLHGYTTEVAITLGRGQQVNEEEFYRMQDKLIEASLPYGDLHGANVGYVVDEETDAFKLVPIDFGRHFTGDW
jgi:hypothetical protein